jgi:replicative DNA helicase
MQRNAIEALARPLPHSSEAERAFLGAILLGAPSSELDRLDASDFFLPLHRTIFRHMKALRDHAKPTDDVALLYESLAEDNGFTEAGGAGFLSQLPDGLPRTSNTSLYAKTVKEKSLLRQLLYQTQSFQDRLLSANGNAAQVLEEVRREFESTITPSVEVESNRFRFKNAADAPDSTETPWLIQGLVPEAAIVSINAKIKLGKTTFVLAMCRAVIKGTDFLSQKTIKTNVVYLSEQTASSFDRALGVAGLRGLKGFSYLPFTETCGSTWSDVASRVLKHCKETEAKLVVVDTLSQFAGIAGDSENDAGAALAAMLPLQKLAAEGIAVIMVRHARKSGGDVEDAGRGSSAFDGAADLILSIRKPDGNQPENRRLLTSSGRYSGETLNNLLIEMSESGFTAIGSQQETVLNDAKDTIIEMAPRSEADAATFADLAEATKIAKITVQRAAEELVLSGKLQRTGKGKRGSPFIHWVEENRFDSTPTIGVEVDSNRFQDRESGDEAFL